MKKWARKVNPSKRITPHSVRATFISSLLESGEDIYTVAQTVNHSDVRRSDMRICRNVTRKCPFSRGALLENKFPTLFPRSSETSCSVSS